MPTPSFARRERHDLCDLALVLGADAPTLCAGWTARELVAHLLVRETRPLGAAGLVVPALSGLTDRAMARMGRQDFAVLVERLRDPGLTPYALPPVERVANTMEYFVHHEDLRRGQPGWEPRALSPEDEERIWRAVRLAGRVLVRPAGVPVRVRRTGSDEALTLRGGDDPVTVTGPTSEVALFLFGRGAVRDLTFDGPPERVDLLRGADLGL
ncbi:TIGR03085 family metal-binding protein [Nocardioides sp. cx-169]|uniref:TIGR03085 family metal-binding protein n=1 Tax=Nocardioides sp. cx-169 TaxID=2899080 RepID=UPI001E50DC1E|nr:TIGR03085 family metal-binding protein [Nocardioides sp. cx-169]MCD4534790.1 TIGR03085 family metal-binding protein [Nocardioides sp. cx-169]